MADYTQTNVTLAPLAMIVHPDSVAHAASDVAGFLTGRVYVYVVNLETTANNEGVTFRVQGRPSSSNGWVDVKKFVTKKTASGAAIGINATEPALETAIDMDADPTANHTAGSEAYVHNTNGASPAAATGDLGGDEANSEFNIVDDSTTGGSHTVNLMEGIGNEFANDDEIVPDAETFSFDIPSLAGYDEMRLLVEHRGASGSNIHYLAEMKTASAIA